MFWSDTIKEWACRIGKIEMRVLWINTSKALVKNLYWSHSSRQVEAWQQGSERGQGSKENKVSWNKKQEVTQARVSHMTAPFISLLDISSLDRGETRIIRTENRHTQKLLMAEIASKTKKNDGKEAREKTRANIANARQRAWSPCGRCVGAGEICLVLDTSTRCARCAGDNQIIRFFFVRSDWEEKQLQRIDFLLTVKTKVRGP